jgi:hypothetical protein
MVSVLFLEKINKLATKTIYVLFTFFITSSLLFMLFNKSIRSDFTVFQNFLAWLCCFLCLAALAVLQLNRICAAIVSKLVNSEVFCYVSIILLTVVPRLVWIGMISVIPKYDFQLYHELATSFSQGNIVGQSYISVFPHTFGFPMILSMFYRIFGSNHVVAQYLNICLACCTSVVLYHLGKKLSNSKTGLMAALVYALWPSQILYTVLVCTETLFTCLVLISILFFCSIIKAHKPAYLSCLLLGILCAAINGIRPFGIVLMIAFTVVMLLDYRIKKQPIKHLVPPLVSIIVLIVTYIISTNLISLGISGVIKKDVARAPIGFNLFVGSNCKYSGAWNSEDASVLQGLMAEQSFDAQETHDMLQAMAIQRYKDQGIIDFELLDNKFRIMWASDDDILTYIKAGYQREASAIDLDSAYRYLRIICNGYYLIMLLLCFIFCCASFRKPLTNQHTVMMLIALGIVFVHLLVEVHGRYHYPAISILALFACMGVDRINYLVETRRFRAEGR